MIILNIKTNNKLTERDLDQDILKDVAFASKIIYDKKTITYNYILLNIENNISLNKNQILYLEKNLSSAIELDDTIKQNIFNLFNKSNDRTLINIANCSIDVVREINIDDFSIVYTDGSFKKSTNQASSCSCFIKESNENGIYDSFTNMYKNYEDVLEIIEDGTNNIGELTGIYNAIAKNNSEKNYQIIIADSEYGLKCYREWYYNWADNDFKTSSKKPISNKDLILKTRQAMEDSNRIILFKWVKGHEDNLFNEHCDEMAKSILDIKK